jgi:8-oxo-dGTP diphosphatase
MSRFDRRNSIKIPWTVLLTGLLGCATVLYVRASRYSFGCARYSEEALRMYEDLQFPLRTPDFYVEAIVSVYRGGRHQGILLCQKKEHGVKKALPGGYVNHGESAEQALVRELREVAGLVVTSLWDDHGNSTTPPPVQLSKRLGVLRQLFCSSDPLRDMRRHTVSLIFDLAVDQTPSGGCSVHAAEDVLRMPESSLIFDSHSILRMYIRESWLM